MILILQFLLPISSSGYDDDTHYYLTYFLARKAGFTQIQSFRIASANISIDYSDETEPIQYLRQASDIRGRNTQFRRIRFHAFQDADQFGEGSSEAGKAAIKLAGQELRARCVNIKNPGGYLHFYQDTYSHDPDKYQSISGHMRDGHAPDFLSDPPVSRAEFMVKGTLAELKKFMTEYCPGQKPRPIDYDGEIKPVLDELIEINPPPHRTNDPRSKNLVDISPDAEAAGRVIEKALAGDEPFEFPTNPAEIQRILKNNSGKVPKTLDKLYPASGPQTRVPQFIRRISYTFDDAGYPAPSERDIFVIAGSIYLKVIGDQGEPINGARVKIWLEPKGDGPGGEEMTDPEVSANGEIALLDMPIGRYRFVVSHPDYESRILLAKAESRVTDVTLEMVAKKKTTPPPAAPLPGRVLIDVIEQATAQECNAQAQVSLATGPAGDTKIININAGVVREVPPGRYVASAVLDYADLATEKLELDVKAGETTKVTLYFSGQSSLKVNVIDAQTGVTLIGPAITLTGSHRYGPSSALAFRVVPGDYTVSVGQCKIGEKSYHGKQVGPVKVQQNRPAAITVRLDPVAQPPRPNSISIEPGWLELNPGDGYQLLAKVFDADGQPMPDAPVAWSSKTPPVAAVDSNGNVSAIGSGKTRIIARSGTATGSIVASVISDSPLSSCEITGPTRLPSRGGDALFKAIARDTDGNVVPNAVISWVSSDYTVSYIDAQSGRVTTENPGRVTFIAEARGADGASAVGFIDVLVEQPQQDVLVSGRVLKADGSPGRGANVEVSGGPNVPVDSNGEFTAIAGRGPHADGARLVAKATLGTVSGTGAGVVQNGFVNDVIIRLGTSHASTAGDPAPSTKPGAGKPTPTVEETNRLFNPGVYLLQINPSPPSKEFRYLLFRGIPDKSKGGAYLVADGTGGVHHTSGELSGPYPDENSVRAVLRGYGIKSADFIGGTQSVSVKSEGPSAPPKVIASTGSKPSGPGKAPQGRAAASSVKGECWIILPGGEKRPLRDQDTIPPGSSIQTGINSHASLRSATGAKITAGSNTKLHMVAPEAGSKSRVVELTEGSIDVDHDEKLPGFEDMIKTPDGAIVPRGTQYHVEVTSRGTDVQVSVGSVYFTGNSLVRTDKATGAINGQPSFVKELNLNAGDRAIALRGMPGAPGNPWGKSLEAAQSGARPNPWEASLNVARTTPGGGPANGLPAVAQSAPHESTAQEILASASPWLNPKVQAAMDEWLVAAKPPINDGKPWRYTSWGVAENGINVKALHPDNQGMTRHHYLWAVCQRLTSADHCTLGEFIKLRLTGGSMEHCRGHMPPAQPAPMPVVVKGTPAPVKPAPVRTIPAVTPPAPSKIVVIPKPVPPKSQPPPIRQVPAPARHVSPNGTWGGDMELEGSAAGEISRGWTVVIDTAQNSVTFWCNDTPGPLRSSLTANSNGSVSWSFRDKSGIQLYCTFLPNSDGATARATARQTAGSDTYSAHGVFRRKSATRPESSNDRKK